MSRPGIWRRWWFPRTVGWRRRVIVTSLTGWSARTERRWLRPRLSSEIFWRRAGPSPRSAPMAWTCSGGSGSCGRSGCRGIGRPVRRPAISPGGCRLPGSRPGLTGVAVTGLAWRPFRLAWRMRRRFARTPRRCCGPSTTFTWMRAAGRSSTRSRWTGRGAAAGRTRTTIRWSPTATSAAGSTGRGCLTGSRAACRTASSTRSSPGCRRTGTGRWSRSTCRPGRGRLSCCRPRWRASTRDGS